MEVLSIGYLRNDLLDDELFLVLNVALRHVLVDYVLGRSFGGELSVFPRIRLSDAIDLLALLLLRAVLALA